MNDYIFNLGKLFYKISEENSERTAIIFEKDGSSVTYSELNNLSNQIGNYFFANKISKNDVIAIFNNKSKYAFASMLAALKIGAMYVNFDFLNPIERLEKIILKADPKLIMIDEGVEFSESLMKSIIIIDLNNKYHLDNIEKFSSQNLAYSASVTSSTPAYIMFTSGSTGFPKGAVMTHQNLLNFIRWGKQRFGIKSTDIFTNVNPMYFDNSVFDFYCSVFNGAAFLALSYETVRDPSKIVSAVNSYRATIWFSVPSMIIYLQTTKSISKKDFSSIRCIVFGGEGFPKPNLKKLFELFGDRLKLVNVYGPTECTCICSAYDICSEDFKDMNNLAPLGKLSPNFGYLIGRENNEEIGELILTGPQIGLGYYNDVERTNASFIQNPAQNKYRDIVYKTGDLVFEDDKGTLYFKGRKDNQIKHMGYRIELEEIESALNTIPEVDESAVVYKKIAEFGGQLFGFITTSNSLTSDIIISELKKKIPIYMLPKAIRIIDRLPKNKNGKTDKTKLMELV